MSDLRSAVQRALSAWDTTTLKPNGDGMLSEAMESLRADFDAAARSIEGAPLPPLPMHPEPHTYTWTALEARAIEQYGKDCARAALASKTEWRCPETGRTCTPEDCDAAPAEGDEPAWYAVTSLRAPIIDKAIRRLDAAEEYADKKREVWPDVEVSPLYYRQKAEPQPKGTAEPVAWIIWTHGPVLVFMNVDEARMKFDWLNQHHPEPARKLLPLYFQAPAPVAGLSPEQIDALMPTPAEPSEPIMKAFSNRAAQRGEYEHVGDTPDLWTRDQVHAVVRAALATQAPAVGADDARDAARYRFLRDADRCDDRIGFEELMTLAMDSFDAAIDAAMGKSNVPAEWTDEQIEAVRPGPCEPAAFAAGFRYGYPAVASATAPAHANGLWTVISPGGKVFIGESAHRAANEANKHLRATDPAEAQKWADMLDRLRAENEAENERLLAEHGTLNCPACGGSGHIGDVQAPAVKAEKPAAWIEHDWSGTGERRLHFERRPEMVRDEVVNPIWTPLYAHPPVQGSEQ